MTDDRKELRDDEFYFRCRKCRIPGVERVQKSGSGIRCGKCGHAEEKPDEIFAQVSEICQLVSTL
jgi:hypothetical protein